VVIKSRLVAPFLHYWDFPTGKAKIGWLCGARQIKRNVSLRSRQVKNFASAGTRPKSMYGFGTMGCKVIVAEFTSWRS
jgi:hypothetical protein